MPGPRLSDGIRLKSESGPIDRAREIERTGTIDHAVYKLPVFWPFYTKNPPICKQKHTYLPECQQSGTRGMEFGYIFGLFTTRIRRFLCPFSKIAFFSVKHTKNLSIFTIIFWSDGRVGLGRFVACRRRPKIKKRLKNHTFIVIGNGHIELSK